jgi:leucine dehydrogenase
MEIFQLMKEHNQEQIAFYTDKSVKLRAMLAIHSTALGPAIGGIRLYAYHSDEEALFDLIRLSQAMTYKTAASGVNFGGGEIVVIDQAGMEKSEALFRALGRFIESFKGRIIAGGDIGVTEESLEYMRMETKHLSGLPAYYGGSGNPSLMCAYGTLKGIMAAAKYQWGSNDISGKKIIVQGYGRTGASLAGLAREKGARIVVADIDPEKVKKAAAERFETIAAEKIYTEKCDILAPCAVGVIVTPETAAQFQCEIIAGTANNQLLSGIDDFILKKRKILYAPDFIINAGAVIDVAEEYSGYKKEKVERKIENIYDRLLEIFKTADDQQISNNQAAIRFARQRIDSIKRIKGTFLRKGKV